MNRWIAVFVGIRGVSFQKHLAMVLISCTCCFMSLSVIYWLYSLDRCLSFIDVLQPSPSYRCSSKASIGDELPILGSDTLYFKSLDCLDNVHPITVLICWLAPIVCLLDLFVQVRGSRRRATQSKGGSSLNNNKIFECFEP